MKADDSLLDTSHRERVRQEAKRLLLKVGGVGRFPTPVDDVLAAAKLEVVPEDLSNLPFLDRLRKKAGDSLKRALSKIMGVFDAKAGLIFIDRTVYLVKQTFLKLHEAGHAILSWQRDIYKVIEECDGTLDPVTADLFDREANFFATEVLFQLDSFINESKDYDFGLKVPLKLSKKYGASAYAAVRQYVSKNHRACAVVVLDPPQIDATFGFRATTHRVLHSPRFPQIIGAVDWPTAYTPQDLLWELIPLEKKRMSRPRSMWLTGRDGRRHKCVAEGFKTQFYTLILIHAEEVLSSRILLPGSPSWSQASGKPTFS